MPLRKEDFEEALVEFKKLRNFRHRNVVEAIAYCKEPAMFGESLTLITTQLALVFSDGIHGWWYLKWLVA